MAFPKELTLISLLLVIFVGISIANVNQPSKLDKASTTFIAGKNKGANIPKSEEKSSIDNCNEIGQVLLDSDSCSTYYVCTEVGSIPPPSQCPYGYNWNPELGYCDYNYMCPFQPVCTDIAQTFPYPDDCSVYYYCTSSTSSPTLRTCPQGMFFNFIYQICDYVEAADCKTRPACLDYYQQFPDFYDCTQNYICSESLKPIKYRCPINTSYDSVFGDCVPTRNAICASF